MQPVTPSAKWYQHITQIPLSKFIDVAVDDNYAALVITGYPAIEELQLAWSQISGEYADAIGDNEHRMYVSLFRDVTLLTVNLKTINYLVEILERVYHEPFAEQLNKLLSTNFQFDHTDPEKYFAQLKNCLMRSKALKINLDLKEMQLKAIREKHQAPGQKLTREYFQSILITLSDHVQYPVTDGISVYEFCDRIKRFNKHCEQVKRQQHGRRAH
jgi:hypothetical protein